MTLDDASRDRLGALPTANIGDAMERLFVMEAPIKSVWPGARMVGPAFCVLTAPGDNKAIHSAIDEAAAGDVIVVAAGGYADRALIGELMAGRAAARGLAGMVIDGAVRDAQDIGAMRFPVFARGITPAGPYRNGPGRQQIPVAIGGVAVCPGDVVVGDDDGVVVIRRQELDAVLARAEAKHAAEATQRAEIGV
ncbi:RraA family protein [Cryobacterium tepidiphilum]|uniref:Putative 4-hydroxy-4-methyl-2-oxoglutarate aldolase n=1 Tax=Cryobacterium tepidiphilum TaxID=2486026 RepID=A0A3M8KXZ4_9MICO|nr:methyltransferase [Cryobacterium tepidiphilum]RNE57214.1 methyltransferase [Cryobacterium tepidiphilum]